MYSVILLSFMDLTPISLKYAIIFTEEDYNESTHKTLHINLFWYLIFIVGRLVCHVIMTCIHDCILKT